MPQSKLEKRLRSLVKAARSAESDSWAYSEGYSLKLTEQAVDQAEINVERMLKRIVKEFSE